MVKKNAKPLITGALLQLLEGNTLDHIDIQDISDLAGLSRQTFYYNFKNKQDLLCWIMQQDFQLAIDAFRRSGDMFDYLNTALHGMRDKAIFYRSIAASDSRRRSSIGYFANGMFTCAQMIENSSYMGRMSPELHNSLHFFVYGASGMMLFWVENGMQQEPDQLAQLIKDNMPENLRNYFDK